MAGDKGSVPGLRDVQLVMDSVKDYAIFLLDPSGIILTWNTGARELKGYEPSEIIGQSFTRFYTPEDKAAGEPARLLRLAAEEGRVESEGWRIRKDGSRFWADVVISPIRDAGREIRGFVKVTRDLTARREAEESIRQSEERLRLLIDSVTDHAIFMVDPEGRIASWNSGAQRMKGYRALEVIGRHISLFYTPEDRQADRPAKLLRIAAAEGRVEDEGWRVRKDGSRFWADVVLGAIRDREGRLIGYTKVTRDMTERRRAAEELAERARQQAAVSDLGLFALQSPRVEEVIERAVQTAARVLGSDVVNVLESQGDGRVKLVAGLGVGRETIGGATATPAPRTQVAMTLASGAVVVQNTGADPRIDASGLFHEASPLSALTVLINSSEQAGRPHGVLGVGSVSERLYSQNDVNFLQAVANVMAVAIARTNAERQLRTAEREAQAERDRSVEAERALRQRDEFISVAAHELRTPLTALQLKVQGFERAVEQGSNLASVDLRGRVSGVARQTERLARLVEQLLDVSRIATGTLELHPERFDLGVLIRQVAEDFRASAAAARSELQVEVAATAEGAWDRLRLEQVLVNLVSNAIKYGAGKPITVHLEATPEHVQLSVRDRGIGIAPEDLARIFGRFERAAPVRNYAGLGLGLYIVRHIVEAHGGSIAVASHPGEGATFTVELPRAAVDRSEDARKQVHP